MSVSLSEGRSSFEREGLTISAMAAFARLRDEAALLASFFASPEGGALPVRRAGCKGRMVVGLLSPSCDDFLLALFACLRLGLGVLLIA